jgi:hypothetical protein
MKTISVNNNDKWPEAISDGLTLPCQKCGEIPIFDYVVDDKLWNRLVPKKQRKGVLCISCLDKMAFIKKINIADYLIEIQFIGKHKTIRLIPSECYCYKLKSV